MTIVRMIIHSVDKPQTSRNVTIQYRDSLLEVSPSAEDFLTQMEKAYERRGTKQQGVFRDDEETYPFQTHLRTYFDDPSDESFIAFSRRSAERFGAKLEQTPAATGGYLLMVHGSTEREDPQFFVIILTDRMGMAIDPKTLDLRTTLNVDLDHLNMGSKIRIHEWQADPSGGAYLSFLAGRKVVSNYFTDFVGCTRLLSDLDATRRLYTLVSGFAGEHRDTMNLDDALARVYEHVRAQKVVSVASIANILSPENPDAFFEHMDAVDIRIDGEFTPHGRELKRFVFREYDSDDLKLTVKQRLINSGQVTYSKDQKKVIIDDHDGKIGRKVFGLTDTDQA